MAVLFLGADSKKTGTLFESYPGCCFPQDPPRVKGSIRQGSHTPQSTAGGRHRGPTQRHRAERPVTPEEAQRCQPGSWPWMAVRCRLTDGFQMRVLCRLPAVPMQASDQQGCFAPLPSHTYLETSHLQRAAINLCGRQAGTGQDRGAASKLLCPVCLPWRVGQALTVYQPEMHQLASTNSPGGRQTQGLWRMAKGAGLRAGNTGSNPSSALTGCEAFSKSCHFSGLHLPPLETCNYSELG